ncbi:MAG: hypothetical protein IKJ65_02330 [Clostridia bacterium]|nr:hypothetical protein [Clostridia bacterium]
MIFNRGWPGRQRPLDQTEIAGFVRMESNGEVFLTVTVREEIREACVRPLGKNISVDVSANTLSFRLPGPGQYVLEVNGDHEPLNLFVSPETEKPILTDKDLYFGAGEHDIGIFELQSNQTVYIDAGAVVYGGFVAFGKENIKITGMGILDGSRETRTDDTRLVAALGIWEDALARDFFLDNDRLKAYIDEHKVLNGLVRFYNCKNCEVSHVTLRDSSSFAIVPAASENIVIDDIKMIGMWRYNSDGVDYFNSSNCILKNSFLRNFDDCVVIKGMCGWGHKNNENIITENCVVWCDWGRGLEIGAETNADEYRNIVFKNCDVIHGSWLHLDIQHHNDAYIHDVLFDDIRVEYSKYQQPLKFQSRDDETYDQAPVTFDQPQLLGAFFFDMGLFGPGHSGQKIERIVFRNIQVLSDECVPMPRIGFEGLDEENSVRHVLIENLTRNGAQIKTREEANLHTNGYAFDIVIR